MSGQGSGPKQAWLVWIQVDAEHVEPGSSEMAVEQQVGQDRPLSLWSMRGNPTGRCSGPGRCAPVALGPGWPTTLHSTHIARPLTRNKLRGRTNSSSQPSIHPNVNPRESSKTPQQVLATQEYVLQLSRKGTVEEYPLQQRQPKTTHHQ